MIDVTGVDLVKFAQKVYALSGPGYWLWQRLRRQKDAAA